MASIRLKKPFACGGFSLLELSIVIAIVSMVAIMGLEASAAYLSSTAYKSTEERMKVIDAALVKYRYVHGRLPCPALLPTAVTADSYGKEDCATAPVAGVGVTSVAVTNPGSGYIGTYLDVPLTIVASSGTGASATGIVGPITGAITSISLSSGGSGYAGATIQSVTPDNVANGASAADLASHLVVSGDAIACAAPTPAPCTVAVTSPGSRYTQSYTSLDVTFSGGSGLAASATANVDPSTGEITSVTITNPGYGYAATDVVTVNLGAAREGSAAIATVALSAIRVGGLPVRDLNLPLSYAQDAYGSKFIYYVTDTLTRTDDFNTSAGAIHVRTGQLEEPCGTNCAMVPGGAAYVFLSVGKDQRGGYGQRGTLINNCIPRASFSSAIDAQNCIFQGTPTAPIAVNIPLGVLYNSQFNNGNQNSNYLDDLIIVRAKQDL